MKYLSVFALVFLVGCADRTMNRVMSSWDGAHIDQVISQWGYPDSERTIAGKRIYTWTERQSYAMPGTSTSTVNVIGNTAYVNTQNFGGGVIDGVCQRILEVDESNIVTAWQWSGNNCPLMDVAFGYENWERRAPSTPEQQAPPEKN